MASLTQAARHSVTSHDSPAFSAIRFHSLDVSENTGGNHQLLPPVHHSLVYTPLIPPALPAHNQHLNQQSVLVQPDQFGSFAAAFASTFLGPAVLPSNGQQQVLQLQEKMANGQVSNTIADSALKPEGTTTASVIIGAENSPPQISLTGSLSNSSGPDSDGRSCSSSSYLGATNSSQSRTYKNGTSFLPSGGQKNGQKLSKKQLVRDQAYWERRRKNNDAAKRSRDSRRRKEDEVAVRAVILEQENFRLRFELERLRTEIGRHRIVAFSQGVARHQEGSSVLLSAGHPMALAAAAVAQMTNGTGRRHEKTTFPSAARGE